MTINVSEFPCIEATRCLVGENEIGQRVTVKAAPSDSKEEYLTTFTTEQSPTEEWYMHLDRAESDEIGPGGLRYILQFRHIGTGQFLSCEEKGKVNCISIPCESTWWWVQRVNRSDPQTTKERDPLATKSDDHEPPPDHYILISKQYPNRKLSYTRNLDDTGDEYMLITTKSSSEAKSVWTLKFTSGELCFMANPVVHLQIRCNLMGSLSLTSQCNGWEVFRFIEVGNGDVHISSWVHYKRFLTSNTDGQVSTTDAEPMSLGYAERWRLEVPPNGNGVYIRNVASRRYLSVGRKRSEHLWTTTQPNDYALWHLNHPHEHIYYMTSLFTSTLIQPYSKEDPDDVHISSSKEGPFLAMKAEKEEEWKMEVSPEGSFTFFSTLHEKYLGCNSTGDVHTTTSKGAWTLWEKEVSPDGGVMFLSKENQRYLTVANEEDSMLCTNSKDEGTDLQNCFRLDPRLPNSVSGGTGGMIADVMGLTLAVASPFAVLGAIEASEAILPNNLDAVSIRSSEEIIEKYNVGVHRPLSAWKFWESGYPDAEQSSDSCTLSIDVGKAEVEENEASVGKKTNKSKKKTKVKKEKKKASDDGNDASANREGAIVAKEDADEEVKEVPNSEKKETDDIEGDVI